MIISIGHTPDTDDAFMFHAMLNQLIDTEGLVFEDNVEPLSSLNLKAIDKVYQMTAVSIVVIPDLADKYDILSAGACMAEQRGPVLCFRKGVAIRDVAVPGFNTTACFAARLYNPEFQFFVRPFDKILEEINSGISQAGLLINEDQMRIDRDLCDCIDLGEWWFREKGLPLPLGIDLIDNQLASGTKRKVCRVFRKSIEFAFENQDQVVPHAMKFGRGIDPSNGMRFVRTFVNKFSIQLGARGREAILFFLDECASNRIIKTVPKLNFIT